MDNNYQDFNNKNTNFQGGFNNQQDNNYQNYNGQAQVPIQNNDQFMNEQTQVPVQNNDQFMNEQTQVPVQNNNQFMNQQTQVPAQNNDQFMNQQTQMPVQNNDQFMNQQAQMPVQNNDQFMNQQINNYQGNNQNYNQYNNQQMYYPNNGQNYSQQMYYPNSKKNNKLKVIIIILFAVVALLLLIWGILSKNGINLLSKFRHYDRTIMVYMVGSDLEQKSGLATEDLNGVDYSKLKEENTKLIVIAGGTTSWHNSYIDADSTSIYELTENGYKIVKKQPRLNMGGASVLTNFLNYGYTNYSADKYDLIFWDHGMGVLGSENDVISNDYLDLKEIRAALSNTKFNSNNKLEFILFRTCLNGTLEVADTIKDYAEYMIASQEVTLGYKGNNIFKVLNTIDSSDDGKQVGIKYVDAYMNYINTLTNLYSSNASIYKTYSIIDLSKVSELEFALNDFIKDIDLSKNYNQIARIRSQMLQYGSDYSVYDSIDLYNFVNNIKSLSPTKAQKLLDCINNAIIYNKSSDTRSKGLSIYLPYNGTTDEKKFILSEHYNFTALSEYKNFITTFNTMQTSNTTPMSFAGNIANLSHNSKDDSSDFQLQLTNEQASKYAKSGYMVFKKAEKEEYGNTYMILYGSNDVKMENNVLKANLKGRQLKVVDKSDKSESLIPLIEEENTDDYIIYHTFVLLSDKCASDIFKESGSNNKITSAKINLMLDKKTNEIKILNAFMKTSDDANTSLYNVAINLEDYGCIGFITTLWNILDENGNVINNWSQEVIGMVQLNVKDMEFKLEDFTNSKDIYAAFVIYDVYGNSSYSKLIKMK